MHLEYDLYEPPGDREENLPPVILLHGMMDSRKTWKNLAPMIATHTGRKVFAYDARNHGDSSWADEFNFDILAEDLDCFMRIHRIPIATIVGHSMGGKTAMTLALRKPEKVEKLIVEDITPHNIVPRDTGPVVQLLQLQRQALEAIPPGSSLLTAQKSITDFALSFLPPGHGSTFTYDYTMLPIKKTRDGYEWQANLSVIEEVLTSDKLRQNLSGVYMGDALFIYGTKSFFKVGKSTLIPKFFPKHIKYRVEGAGHLIHLEKPQEFLQEVLKFITGKSYIKSRY